MTTATRREAPNHNTLTCYTRYKCRLPDCVERYRANERTRRRQQRRGEYQRLTDAAPVREHVRHLLATGASPRAIAIRADVAGRVVRDLLPASQAGSRTPRKYRVLADNAAKILAVTPDDVVPHYVPALGSVRRLQALVADGMPMIHIAPHVDLYPSYISSLLWRADELDNHQVFGTTALAITRGYNHLSGKNPLRYGATRKSKALARRIGASRNWPTSKYWARFPDAIDDPHFTPEYKVTKAEILAEETRWLIETAGLTRTEAAERLRKDRSYIDRVLNHVDLKQAA
ncbi:hypothetical protein [Streptomyces badius]|uniref:Uncharacterized protein n=1 Tax=Streptomyces badius TaxID=1941 RepID=A0ABQ2TC75_STRBA|nr:hypothetical protein [Streptomyces badius]GGS63351.1 hypothetical protein GCM10010253_42760 [Streptomyces badius]